MLQHPVWTTVFRRAYPKVRVLDVRSDTGNLTTYTFSGCNIGDIRSGAFDWAAGADIPQRTPTRKLLFVIVHAEDGTATFGVSNLTVGGTAIDEEVDRGGATNAINTAIYAASPVQLAGITNTDISVTFTEAITGCAIGVVQIENIQQYQTLSNGNNATGTGALTTTQDNAVSESFYPHAWGFIGTTLATGGLTEKIQFDAADGPITQLELLYEGSTAEFDYAAAFYTLSHYVGANNPICSLTTSWSGAGAGDVVLKTYK